MRRRKKKKEGYRVIFLILIPIILIGGIGIFMLINNKSILKNKTTNKTNDKVQQGVKKKSEDKVNADLEAAPSNATEFSNLSDGDYKTSKGFTLKIKDGKAYVDGNLIVNKTYKLPNDYKPDDPYTPVTSERCTECIDKTAMEAFKVMKSDAQALGLNIYLASGYRSYNYQTTLYDNYVKRDGKEAADKYSSRPGYSEHQSGLCFDLNNIEDSFADTQEVKWINENAYLYGFVIRFPKGKESETGYQYESWHLRYVGKDLAKKLYNNGDWLSLEGYYGLSCSY